MMMVKTAPW
jgi:hypothetical protein